MAKWRQSIWLRYVVTYVLVLAVPFFAFSAFFSHYIYEAQMKEMQAEMRRTLAKIQTDFDQKVTQMRAISIQLAMIRDFKTASLQTYSFETWTSIERALVSYLSTTMFFSDIIYYNSIQPSTVFTTQGTYNAAYYRSFLQDGEWLTIDQLSDSQLSRGWYPCAHTSTRRVNLGNALLFSHRLNDVDRGYLLFEIREDAIKSSLLSSLPDDSEVYILLDGIQLYPFHQEAPQGDVLPGGMPQALEDGRFQYASASSQTGLMYVYITTGSDVAVMVRAALGGFILLSVIVSLLCFIAILMVARRHARPIERLISLADGIAPSNGNGLARVHSAMHHLQSRSQELDETRRQAMREHALIRLIRGKYRGEQEAEDNLQRLEMTFSQPLRVIVLLLREQGQGQEEQAVESRITQLLMRRHNVYGFAYAEHSVYVMMLDIARDGYGALAEEMDALLALPGLSDARVRFSLGCAFEGFMQAQDSFMQALFASSREPGAPVTIFTHSDEADLFYPHEELRALSDALACQDRNRTAFLHDVLLMLVHRNIRIYIYAVSLLSEMIHLYWQALSVFGAGVDSGYAARVQSENVNDINDMLTCVRRLHESAMRQMTDSALVREETDIIGIANYITACENLDSLTVGDVASRFGMNVSSLSHKFKEQMGCNISDYILTRKMSHACMLLRTSDLAVADIAARVGYSQYTSFVRQFKRQKGMTPTAYRDEWRQNEPDEGTQ